MTSTHQAGLPGTKSEAFDLQIVPPLVICAEDVDEVLQRLHDAVAATPADA